VINFDMPDTVDAYTHRIGRTGRAHLTGEALTFAGQSDETMVREIEKALGAPIERRWLPGFDYGRFAPERQFQPNRQAQPRQSPSRSGYQPARPRASRAGGAAAAPRGGQHRRRG
jgi:ATP-dependent RNA helicase RhlE